MTSARVVDVFLRYLKTEEVEYVFGIVGGLLHPFFAAVERDPDLNLVMSRHEEGAAFMADGYARVSRRLAVCAGTSGPGATNLVTGVACAFADGVPMLVVTGQAASHALGKGAAQETPREGIDIVDMFRPITKYSAMAMSPQSIPHHLRRAMRAALTGRPGPVHLNIPVDFWEKPLEEDWFDPKTYRSETHPFDRLNVQKASEALIASEYPLLLAGSGVATTGAEEHLRTLAELLGARVVTTPRAKGVFPEDHPLSLGILGLGGHRDAKDTALGGRVDTFFSIGASLSETSTFNWSKKLIPQKMFIQLDVDSERVGRNYPVDIPLIGDARSILHELVYHLHRKIRDGVVQRSRWSSVAAPTRGHLRFDTHANRTNMSTPVYPERWRVELEEVLPDDALIFSDIGGHMMFNIHHMTIRAQQRFFINLGFGSMGHGTVAPIGAAIVSGKPVVAIIGDGCFMMNGMELLTAVEHDIPVVWIVENNNMHGVTWHGSRILGQGIEAVRYKKPIDIHAIAKGMGLWTGIVEAPGQIQSVFAEAMRNAPALIDVRVDSTVVPPLGERAKSLAGFIEDA